MHTAVVRGCYCTWRRRCCGAYCCGQRLLLYMEKKVLWCILLWSEAVIVHGEEGAVVHTAVVRGCYCTWRRRCCGAYCHSQRLLLYTEKKVLWCILLWSEAVIVHGEEGAVVHTAIVRGCYCTRRRRCCGAYCCGQRLLLYTEKKVLWCILLWSEAVIVHGEEGAVVHTAVVRGCYCTRRRRCCGAYCRGQRLLLYMEKKVQWCILPWSEAVIVHGEEGAVVHTAVVRGCYCTRRRRCCGAYCCGQRLLLYMEKKVQWCILLWSEAVIVAYGEEGAVVRGCHCTAISAAVSPSKSTRVALIPYPHKHPLRHFHTA